MTSNTARTLSILLLVLSLARNVQSGVLCNLGFSKYCPHPKPTPVPTSKPTNKPIQPTKTPTLAPVVPPKKNVTLAAYGDWPYSQTLLDNKAKLINSVNNDSSVSYVVHVGDIHSGSMPCTGAGVYNATVTLTNGGLTGLINPVVNPGWNTHIYNVFQQFKSSVIYTPGDNEWADCHKTKQFLSGAPLEELKVVRELFFSQPGRSLGLTVVNVTSQGVIGTGTDKDYVENVRFTQQGIVFATFNIPGGSNDDDNVTSPWTAPYANGVAQGAERIARSAANLNWLNATFDYAVSTGAPSVVLMTQADMWDTEKIPSPGLNLHTPFIALLASRALAFNKPVLLINGDSHVFKYDSPLVSNNATAAITAKCDLSTDPAVLCDLSKIHNLTAVPNFRRLVVKGSAEAGQNLWSKVIIDPTATTASAAFIISNVCYDNC